MWPFVWLLLSVTEQHQTALAAYKQHQFAQAAALFVEALKSESPGTPEYRESVTFLGQSLFLEGKYADAIPWLEKAVAADPALPEAAYMLGNACILTGRTDQGVKAFAGLFEVPANSAAAHLTTARMMMHRDLTDAAVEQARIALSLDPRTPEAHFLLGEAAIYHGDIERGIVELKREIALNPGYAMAHYRLGDALGRLDKWDEAMAPLERSVWLNPNFSGPFILLGRGYMKRKELANAEGVLRHALRLDPQNTSAHYMLGQTLMQLGRRDDARKEFARWQELKGNN